MYRRFGLSVAEGNVLAVGESAPIVEARSRLRKCVCVCTCLCACVRVCASAYVCTCLCACVRVHVCVHVCMKVHVDWIVVGMASTRGYMSYYGGTFGASRLVDCANQCVQNVFKCLIIL